jgi:hypothetical protein
VAALFGVGVMATDTQAADRGQVPAGLLAQMGMSDMQIMSDKSGHSIRGQGNGGGGGGPPGGFNLEIGEFRFNVKTEVSLTFEDFELSIRPGGGSLPSLPSLPKGGGFRRGR